MTIKQQGGIFGRNPTFNDVTIDGQLTFDGDIDVNSDLKVDGNLDVTGTGDFGGKVKVTEAGNGEVEVERISGALINLQAQSARGVIGTNSNHELQLKSNNTGRLKITTAGNVEVMSGNLVIGTSGKGIDFSATSGTGTSELFDDYEEGTWTPAIEIYGTPGTYTATTSGIYTKVGNLVTVTGRLINVTESVAGGADYFKITGLPFTDIAGYSAVGSVSLGNWNVPACYNAFVTFDSTGARDYVIMGLNVDNGATDYLDKTHLVSGTSDIEFTISYFT
jgi:hypothetical protein